MTERHAEAIAHPNIALVKYWGKRDAALNLPAAGSLSLTLGPMHTRTRVVWGREVDSLSINGVAVGGVGLRRTSAFLDLVRREVADLGGAHVESANDFPTAAGLASSSSGFAALALAATHAAGLRLTPAELSVLARRGSGSAARSIFGGFAVMDPGQSPGGEDAHASPLRDAPVWPLEVTIAVTTEEAKDVSSTRGMNHTMETSPYYRAWIDTVAPAITRASRAILARDFDALAAVAEASAMQMHASAIAADPAVLYWNDATVRVIHEVRSLRARGYAAFFTIDAGPHVKVFSVGDDTPAIAAAIAELPGVLRIIHARTAKGARLAIGTPKTPIER